MDLVTSLLHAFPSTGEEWVDTLTGAPLRITVIIVLSFVGLYVANRLINRLTESIAEGRKRGPDFLTPLAAANPLNTARRAQRARTIGSVLRSSVALVIGAAAILMVLSEVGMNITPLIASAGVAGVALGFGAQSLVKDFLSGAFMLIEDQYGVGDIITVGSVTGTVEAIALRTTKVRDLDGTLWFIRNGEVLTVGNLTQGFSMTQVTIAVPAHQEVDEVRAALLAAGARVVSMDEFTDVITGETEVFGPETLDGKTVSFRVALKTSPAMQWAVARKLRGAIRQEFRDRSLTLA